MGIRLESKELIALHPWVYILMYFRVAGHRRHMLMAVHEEYEMENKCYSVDEENTLGKIYFVH
jgi:hypothetical protein